jgi:hypothetical protein
MVGGWHRIPVWVDLRRDEGIKADEGDERT